MNTINAIKTGLIRSLKAWKGILIVWFFYLLFVALLVLPVRSSLKSGFGSSMITERFASGFDIEAFSDLEQVGRSLLSSLSSGLLIALLFGIIMNAFLSGGLFGSLKANAGIFSASGFFSASGKYFWKFLFITLIISAVILLLGFFILILPVSLVVQSEPDSEKAPFITAIISGSAFLFILIILLLIADYARAWNVTKEKPRCFRAIGFALSRTFERFRSSFMLVLIIILVQALLTLLVVKFIGTWRPSSGAGVFLLFIVSQVLFITRLLIRTWRFASVTNLMEQNDLIVKPQSETPDTNTIS